MTTGFISYKLCDRCYQCETCPLDQAGSFYGRGECCTHVIQDDYILPVISPLSGSIQMVNARLKKEPGLILSDPGGDGWLLTIKPGNLESDLKKLLRIDCLRDMLHNISFRQSVQILDFEINRTKYSKQ